MVTDPESSSTPIYRSELSFRLDEYRTFVRELGDVGYSFRTFDERPGSSSHPKEIFLRHDVDLSPAYALRMAEIECELGVTSTFFFLATSPAYNPVAGDHRNAISVIAESGHEVGLHFNPHHYWNEEPSTEELRKTLHEERNALSEIVGTPITAVSTHIPPEWSLDRSYPEVVHAYSAPYFSEIEYISDSDQKWRSEPPFSDEPADTVQILVHPGQWTAAGRPHREVVLESLDRAEESLTSYFSPFTEL